MTAVPYTFANQSGNIPLSELDDNFATLANAVPAYADAAGIATVATTAGSAGIAATVTANAQANITSVGTLTFLDVSGNISGNYFVGNGSALSGVTAGNLTGNTLSNNIVNSSLTTVGNLVSLSVLGNVQASNVNILQDLDVTGVGYIFNISSTGTAFLTTVTADTVSAVGNISTANNVISTGNVQAGNLRTTGVVSATGNVQAGNLRTTGVVSATGNIVTANNVTATGNVSATNFLGNIIGASGNLTSFYSPLLTTENIYAVGVTGVNISANGNNNLVVLETDVFIQNVPLSVAGNVTANHVSANSVTAPDIVTNRLASDDSTAISINDGLNIYGDLEIDGNAYVSTNLTVTSVITNFISSDDSTAVVVDDDVTLIGDLDVTGGLRVFGGPFRLPNFTADQIANIVAVNGDMVYNTTLNKFQGYENGSWANII